MEDYALRYTASSARNYSVGRVAITALGVVSFLALEAIGGTITLQWGFNNALIAIGIVSSLIFILGLPICYHAAKEGVDIDLLTRGSGFGYVGSTISSLIYAAFTFIFFALEAAIMATALNLLLDLQLSICYLISALIIVPLVTHGMRRISGFQLISQPVWLLLQTALIVYIISTKETALSDWQVFTGINGSEQINWQSVGLACAVIFPLMAQNGEQVDYLRFLPEAQQDKKRWWLSVIFAGPGWVFVGAIKLMLGSFLAFLALSQGLPKSEATDPTHMYLNLLTPLFQPDTALLIVCLFVILSQLKINVTNAYAGSIAWSNFFSRVTHHHPGRVVWLIFNVTIALILMEMGLYYAFEYILTNYSILVLGWLGSLVADLTINYWLGLRPKKISFMRSRLYDINPVGCLSMLIASTAGLLIQSGLMEENYTTLAPFIALALPFFTVPFISWLTKGKYYEVPHEPLANEHNCCLCEQTFEAQDMHHCPFYSAPICSLCCSLNAICDDKCKPGASLSNQWQALINHLLPKSFNQFSYPNLWQFLGLFGFVGALFYFLFQLVLISHSGVNKDVNTLFHQLYILLMLVSGVFIWLYVLATESRRGALKASSRQAEKLTEEIEAHKATERLLADEKMRAEEANMAKTRYLGGVSHELRTPLNTLYGYAQLMEADHQLPSSFLPKVEAISKNTEHIVSIIEGLLEISRIEAKQADIIQKNRFALRPFLTSLMDIFQPKAIAKDLTFTTDFTGTLPDIVETDEKRFKQILTNLLSNAIKYTPTGSVTFGLCYRNQVAHFYVADTGIGIEEKDQEKIFESFKRLNTLKSPGTGLGLSISRLLAELLGGDIRLESKPHQGTTFYFSLFLPAAVQAEPQPREKISPQSTHAQKKMLLVDDEVDHLFVLSAFLSPLGFHIDMAEDSEAANKKIEHTYYDACILDIRLPDKDGWSVAKSIKMKHPKSQIIMLSGDAIEHHKEALSMQLHDAYLTKPVNFDQLLITLNQLFGKTKSPNIRKKDNTSLPESNNLMNDLMHAASIGHAQKIDDLLASSNEYLNDDIFNEVKQRRKAMDFQGIIALLNRSNA
jgi:signal transduction histidine kinase/CheY-like chemotaxis protein/purine-cytosine permease-like protein